MQPAAPLPTFGGRFGVVDVRRSAEVEEGEVAAIVAMPVAIAFRSATEMVLLPEHRISTGTAGWVHADLWPDAASAGVRQRAGPRRESAHRVWSGRLHRVF